jgi:hypothetical protein
MSDQGIVAEALGGPIVTLKVPPVTVVVVKSEAPEANELKVRVPLAVESMIPVLSAV